MFGETIMGLLLILFFSFIPIAIVGYILWGNQSSN